MQPLWEQWVDTTNKIEDGRYNAISENREKVSMYKL